MGRIYAEAWNNKKFKHDFEADPVTAIRKQFPELQFTHVYKVPLRPPHITDEQAQRMADGKEIIFPNVPIGPLIYYHG